MKLLQGRPEAVVDAFVKSSWIDPGRLQSKGGDTTSVASNETEDGKAKNRGVELREPRVGVRGGDSCVEPIGAACSCTCDSRVESSSR
jgi:hypothetical protein